MIKRHHLKAFPERMVLFPHRTAIFRFQRQRLAKVGISLSVMKNLFEPKAEHSYNLRYISHVAAPSLSTLFHGTESISSLWPRICSLLPEKFKNFDSLKNLKILTKKWKPENCPCRLCKFLQNRDFYRTKTFALFPKLRIQ